MCKSFFYTSCLVLVLQAGVALAGFTMSDITGQLEGGSLTRFSTISAGTSPTWYVDFGSTDFILEPQFSTFSQATASGSTLFLSAVDSALWRTNVSGRSVITFTGLNVNGDNWTGLATNTNNAATLIDSNTLNVDFALLGLGTAGNFELQSANAIPEPSAFVLVGLACLGLASNRRRI